MRSRLYAGSFFDFFPFSCCRLCYFVFSALNFGEFKCCPIAFIEGVVYFYILTNTTLNRLGFENSYICWLVPVATISCAQCGGLFRIKEYAIANVIFVHKKYILLMSFYAVRILSTKFEYYHLQGTSLLTWAQTLCIICL